MKKYQFEEITFGISVIIAILAYQNDLTLLCWIFTLKALSDLNCAVKAAKKNPEDFK